MRPVFIFAVCCSKVGNSRFVICLIMLKICIYRIRSPQPLVLAWLVKEFEPGSVGDQVAIYTWATVLVLISLGTVFLMHHANFGGMTAGMRVRIAVSSLIYRKVSTKNTSVRSGKVLQN